MKKKYQISQEEFEAIKEAVRKALDIDDYKYIEAASEGGSPHCRRISMSKEIFFTNLASEFIIE